MRSTSAKQVLRFWRARISNSTINGVDNVRSQGKSKEPPFSPLVARRFPRPSTGGYVVDCFFARPGTPVAREQCRPHAFPRGFSLSLIDVRTGSYSACKSRSAINPKTTPQIDRGCHESQGKYLKSPQWWPRAFFYIFFLNFGCCYPAHRFGGIHLGPDRFKHINNAARELLVRCGATAGSNNVGGSSSVKLEAGASGKQRTRRRRGSGGGS